MSVTITLEEPVAAHGETLAALTLRKPTGKDIRICGYPMRFDLARQTEVQFVEESMHRMISQLADIPPSSVDLLSPGDWMAAALVVARFLAPRAATSSTDTSSRPGSGAPSTP